MNHMPTMTKVLINLPVEMKRRLDVLKNQGYTASGFIMAMLEKELNAPKKKGT